jgi:proteasome assembly chaperone (PAC2) family protein
MDAVTVYQELPTNVTTLVMAFGGWINAGKAAMGALRFLVDPLAAPRVASIDPDDFFVLTQERPLVRLTPEGLRDLQWPQADFFLWQPQGQPGLLLFGGPEPHLRWRTYAGQLLDVAARCGVQRIVSLGALLAPQPHTRPPRVTGRSTDPAWQAQVEAWGLVRQPTRRQGSPTGMSSVVLEAATRRGMTHLTLMAHAPHYLQGAENPAVLQALLTVLSRVLALGLDVSRLDEAVQRFRARCDAAMAEDPAARAQVQRMEQDYDAEGEAAWCAWREETPDPERLMHEVEEFLREEREGGSGG